MTAIRHALLSLVLATLVGCTYAPDWQRPAVEMPESLASPEASADWPDTDWWRAFGSPALDALVEAARARNPDLGAAMARVDQAAARARIAGAPLLPAIGLDAAASRQGQHGNGTDSRGTYAGATLGASYEVDLWGRISATQEAEKARLAASRFDRQAITLTLTASVASLYLEILSVRDRLSLARVSLANARTVLSQVEARVRAGTALDSDVAQQRALVAAREGAVPPLEQQETTALAALAVLLDRPAQTFTVPGSGLTAIHAPLAVPGLPSELLLRRPDVAGAEAALAAADADVAAARAAMLPRVDLSADTGIEYAVLNGVGGGTGFLYSLAAGLSQTIFDNGALAGQRELNEARKRELLAAYRGAVTNAFADVEITLKAISRIDRQTESQEAVVEESRRAFELSQAQYRAGVLDLLTVLDTQRSLYDAEDSLAQLRRSRLQARVALFKALGGGWRQKPTNEP